VKILHVETGRHLYGGARQVGYLIEHLASRYSVQNVLVCQAGNPLAQTLTSAECIEIPVAGDADFSLQRRLRQIVREQQPEIVHVHSRRGADVWGGRAARAEGVPVLVTRRVQSSEPALWLRWKLRPFARVIAISTAVYRELMPVCTHLRQLQLIRSAVDSELFKPDPGARERLIERYELPADARIAGMAAQFIPRKGHELLLPVISRVSAQVPGFRLLLFGQGPDRERYEQQVRAARLAGTICFCGWDPDWPALVPGLDLLLHPARREGLGNVVLEAMASGVPVVASAVGGITDAIDRNVDGLLLLPTDIDGWSRAVVRLLSDGQERDRLAERARRKVERRFTIASMAMSYASLYDDLRNNRV